MDVNLWGNCIWCPIPGRLSVPDDRQQHFCSTFNEYSYNFLQKHEPKMVSASQEEHGLHSQQPLIVHVLVQNPKSPFYWHHVMRLPKISSSGGSGGGQSQSQMLDCMTCTRLKPAPPLSVSTVRVSVDSKGGCGSMSPICSLATGCDHHHSSLATASESCFESKPPTFKVQLTDGTHGEACHTL